MTNHRISSIKAAVLTAFVALNLSSPWTSRAHARDGLTVGVDAIEGSFDYVICIEGSRLNVRDETLSRVLFTVDRHDQVRPVQSFGTDRRQTEIRGTTYTFAKVQFPSKPEGANVGWIAEVYLKTRAECGLFEPAAPVAASGWTFPTRQRPTDSYMTGMRRFGASRSGGRRLHAAADLYRTRNEPVVAAASGTVIRDRYYFYEGTYAIEVKHSGGRVARYGEVTGQAAPGVGPNKSVAKGQVIGYIGKVSSGCCSPMLHFELYAGTASGALSQSGTRYQRRSDLMDPSPLLQSWERLVFGTSY